MTPGNSLLGFKMFWYLGFFFVLSSRAGRLVRTQPPPPPSLKTPNVLLPVFLAFAILGETAKKF